MLSHPSKFCSNKNEIEKNKILQKSFKVQGYPNGRESTVNKH